MGETGGNSNTKDSNAGPTAHAEKKLPAKKASAKSTPPKLSKEGAEAPSNDLLEKILTGLSDIKQQQQTTDKNFTQLVDRIFSIEDWLGGDNGEEEYPMDHEEGEIAEDSSSALRQRKMDPKSRFSLMTKRLKGHELSGPPLEDTLASNINDVFINGLKEEEYNSMVKDESLPRPENCTALQTVKCNKMVWDFLSTNAKYLDRKLQNTETSIVKAATLVAQAVDSIAKAEMEIKDVGIDISCPLDGCQDALSLLGHANKQLNMARREALRLEMRRPYSHLCSSSQPYNEWLFGDNEKAAKEIEDTAKIGSKLQYDSNKQSQRGRPTFKGRFMRGRGNMRVSSGYGRGAPQDSKNGALRPRNAFRKQ